MSEKPPNEKVKTFKPHLIGFITIFFSAVFVLAMWAFEKIEI